MSTPRFSGVSTLGEGNHLTCKNPRDVLQSIPIQDIKISDKSRIANVSQEEI